MKNVELVNHFFQILIGLDVSEILVCAGARNAPLVAGLEGHAFKVKSYFEERSAGFYALGRIKATDKPVVVITTSGTAVAELLPSVIEAYYQGLPLIVVTADRPKTYRGSGAPQAIEQTGFFNSYVHKVYDWDVMQTDLKVQFDKKRPLQFNLCFDEPLIDGSFGDKLSDKYVEIEKVTSFKPQITDDRYSADLEKFKNPLLILGQLPKEIAQQVRDDLAKFQIYHYAESLSGLLGDPQLSRLQFNNAETLLGTFLTKNIFTSVVRIGGVPTARVWRDLEKKLEHIPVLSISDVPFTGLARKSFHADYSVLKQVLNNIEFQKNDLAVLNKTLQAKKVTALTELRNSEQNFIFGLSDIIKNQPVYIGNSLPIREWDLFSQGAFPETYGNRGANGIDGQLSTYLGWANIFDLSWAIVGDLTAMYDLSSLGLNRGENKSAHKCIVIINNKGGQIFKKVFNHEKFLNTHDIEFSHWAQMWGWNYELIVDFSDLEKIKSISAKRELRNYVIEIQTDQTQSDAVWKYMEDACKAVTF